MRPIICLLAVFIPLICEAGGTLGFEEIEPLLKENPQLSSFLHQSFILPDSAFAEIRLGPDFVRLGGQRLGPYTVQAQPKAEARQGPVLVTLCTQYQFLDGSGKVIPQGTDQEFQASAVKEELTAVVIREISAMNRGAGCP